MSLTMFWQKQEKKCAAILLKFKDEVCRNPYTDVTPYTRMLAAEFRKWNNAHEKKLIYTLLLNLYAQDVQSLRRDLCKLEPHGVLCKLKAPGTAKSKFPQRARLFQSLYGVAALYIRGREFEALSPLIESVDDWKKYQIHKKYEIEKILYEKIEMLLSVFEEKVCCDPDTDVISYTEDLLAEYEMIEEACIERVIHTLFLNLYEEDALSFRRDIIKVRLLSTEKAAPPQCTDRTNLLQHFYGALSSYIGEDFSDIIAMCDKAKAPGMEQ